MQRTKMSVESHASHALPLMLCAVGLQLLAAITMKLLADASSTEKLLLVVTGLGFVGVLNVARLFVWGVAHRRYPLSSTFPLSSLFFPAMLLVALAFGEQITAARCVGALLIGVGVFLLMSKGSKT